MENPSRSCRQNVVRALLPGTISHASSRVSLERVAATGSQHRIDTISPSTVSPNTVSVIYSIPNSYLPIVYLPIVYLFAGEPSASRSCASACRVAASQRNKASVLRQPCETVV